MSIHDETQHPRGFAGRWVKRPQSAPGPGAALAPVPGASAGTVERVKPFQPCPQCGNNLGGHIGAGKFIPGTTCRSCTWQAGRMVAGEFNPDVPGGYLGMELLSDGTIELIDKDGGEAAEGLVDFESDPETYENYLYAIDPDVDLEAVRTSLAYRDFDREVWVDTTLAVECLKNDGMEWLAEPDPRSVEYAEDAALNLCRSLRALDLEANDPEMTTAVAWTEAAVIAHADARRTRAAMRQPGYRRRPALLRDTSPAVSMQSRATWEQVSAVLDLLNARGIGDRANY